MMIFFLLKTINTDQVQYLDVMDFMSVANDNIPLPVKRISFLSKAGGTKPDNIWLLRTFMPVRQIATFWCKMT